MYTNRQTKIFVVRIILILAMPLLSLAQESKKTPKKSKSNTLCYVCHHDLQTEKIATVHLKNDITCDKCHGPSTNHMHDEMLMTKPDVLIGRTEVADLCRSCHRSHKKPKAVENFRKKWLGRRRPNGRAISEESICTDCHGTHNIVKRKFDNSDKGQNKEWTSLFNGKDLSGWKTSGAASWTVEKGRLIARPGRKGKAGDLITETTYQDYRLSITFQAVWPIEAAILLRDNKSKKGPRVEIFQSTKPPAYTASVSMPKKGLILVNSEKDLVDYQGWNTISAEVRQNHVSVWLNGEQIGTVRITGPDRGRIGLHIEKQRSAKKNPLTIREILIQPIDPPPK